MRARLVAVLFAVLPLRVALAQDALPPLRELRGIPECAPGTPPPQSGQQYTCRPPYEAAGPHLTLALADLAVGVADAADPLLGPALAYAAGLDWNFTRSFGLGVRWQWLGSADEAVDNDDDGEDDNDTSNFDSHAFSAGVRLRLWTDETAREAWTARADGGYLLVNGDSEHSGFFARFSLGRQIGFLWSSGVAVATHLELSYSQGFGDAKDFRALLLGSRFDVELGVPLPKDIEEPPSNPAFAHTLGFQFGLVGVDIGDPAGAGLFSALGLTFGIPFTRALEARTMVDMTYLGFIGHRSALAYAGLAGLRVRFDDYAPIFLEALGGYEFAYGTKPLPYERGAIVDTSLGWRFTFGCSGGFDLGVRYRHGLEDANEELRQILVFAAIDYGSAVGATGAATLEPRRECRPYEVARIPFAPTFPTYTEEGSSDVTVQAPPDVSIDAPPSAGGEVNVGVEGGGGVDVDAGGGVDIEAGGGVDIEAGGEIDVEGGVSTRPVVIEIPLGFALFGGAIRFDIDVRALPRAQIRNAGNVLVQIIGPRGIHARAEAELRTFLGAEATHITSVTHTIVRGTNIRAIFTIFPKDKP